MPTISTTKVYDLRWALFGASINPPNKYPNWPAYLNTQRQSVTDSRTDSGPVPGYKLLIASGSNATSFLTGTRTTLEQNQGLIAFGQRLTSNPNASWDWSFAYGNITRIGAFAGPLGSISSSASNEAKRRFIQACVQAQSALDGSTFLGELREALHMVRNPARSLRTGVDNYFETLRRRRRGNSRQKKKILQDTWLEYQFGWRPLINDISAGSEALSRLIHRRTPFQMVTAKGSASTDFPTPTQNYGSGFLIIPRNCIEKEESVVIYRGVVNLDVTKGISMTAQNLGFRWDTFVPTLWELIPYSFLVDYFTNIGDIIQSWSYAASNLRWHSRTDLVIRSKELMTGQPSWTGGNGHEHEWIIVPHKAKTELRSVIRTPVGGSLIPTMEFSLPSKDSLKWLNLAALATSRRRMVPY